MIKLNTLIAKNKIKVHVKLIKFVLIIYLKTIILAKIVKQKQVTLVIILLTERVV